MRLTFYNQMNRRSDVEMKLKIDIGEEENRSTQKMKTLAGRKKSESKLKSGV